MKKLIPFLVVFAIVFSAMSAFASGLAVNWESQAPAPFVIDPVTLSAIVAFVSGWVSFFLVQGAKALFALTGFDVSGGVVVVSSAIVNVVIDYLAKLIGMQPTDAQPLLLQGILLVISLLTMYGVHYSYRALKGSLPFTLNKTATFKKK